MSSPFATSGGGARQKSILQSMVSKAVWFRMAELAGTTVADSAGKSVSGVIAGAQTVQFSRPGYFTGTYSANVGVNNINIVGDSYLESIFALASIGNGLVLVAMEVYAIAGNTYSTTKNYFQWGGQLPSPSTAGCWTLASHKVGAVYGVPRSRFVGVGMNTGTQSVTKTVSPSAEMTTGRHSLIAAVDGLNSALRVWVDGVETTGAAGDMAANLAAWDDGTPTKQGGLCLMAQVATPNVNPAANTFQSQLYGGDGMKNFFAARFDTHPGETFLSTFATQHNANTDKLPEILRGY